MTDAHLIIWVDRDDYDHLQRAYARVHITPSQLIRIAVDRFLTEPDYRTLHRFAVSVAQPVEPENTWSTDISKQLIHAENGAKVSFRVDRNRRDALRDILREPYSLGAFVRGALITPGIVLNSRYIDGRFRDLVGETQALLRIWRDAPAEPVWDLDLIDVQPDMTKRRGAALKRPKAAGKLAI